MDIDLRHCWKISPFANIRDGAWIGQDIDAYKRFFKRLQYLSRTIGKPTLWHFRCPFHEEHEAVGVHKFCKFVGCPIEFTHIYSSFLRILIPTNSASLRRLGCGWNTSPSSFAACSGVKHLRSNAWISDGIYGFK